MTSKTRQVEANTAQSDRPLGTAFRQGRLDDIGELNEAARGWSTDFRQVDMGSLDADLAQLTGQSMILTRVELSRNVAQRGISPPGMMTIGIRLDQRSWMEWCGQVNHSDSILCFHPDNGFECLSPAGFIGVPVAIDESLIAKISARLGYPDLLGKFPAGEVVEATGSDRLSGIRAMLHRAFSDLSSGALGAKTVSYVDQLETQLAEELVLLLSETQCKPVAVEMSDRSRAVKRALAHIIEHASEAVTVSEVCEASGVSWRTLNRAFQEFLGTTPKGCLKVVRLNGVRRDLVTAEPSASVTDIANNWGFWHLGDFAKNYRSAFHELPSETLGSTYSPSF